MKNKEPAPNCSEKEHTISLLAVITPKHTAELERILSHTGWQTHFVASVQEAMQTLKSLPVSVVLCEDRLADGGWLELVEATEKLRPSPQTIVLSANADRSLWAKVLNRGGYDLLTIPLEPQEVYAVVPMAWRRWIWTAETSSTSTAEPNSIYELFEVPKRDCAGPLLKNCQRKAGSLVI